ncbi:hypothetical protein Cni_G13535 [Canna indica]|uniref:RBR-type E3 ubiquitin transferase n=1 Tax=Canna indica TaxID=4628 RepID=A0AAQ3QD59_9LILI|nr:hypothetical protein Cni_G13535 [Canna indica]
MNEAADLNIAIATQHRELMAATAAESDLELAFRLQMEEAMAASLATHLPSSSAAAAAASSSSSFARPIIATTATREIGNANQGLADAMRLQTLELDRYQLEAKDRERSLTEICQAVENLRRRAYDERFAREILAMPDDDWEEYGDEFERPIDAADTVYEPNFRIYFKGMTREQVSNGASVQLAAIAVAICDPNDNLVLKIQKPVLNSDVKKCREMLESTALIEGLNAVISLGIKRVHVFCEYNVLYNHLKGIWACRRVRIIEAINQVKLLKTKLEMCEIVLLTRSRIKYVFRLARDAIDSQVRKNVGDPVDLKVSTETCNICLEDTVSSEMFTIDNCFHRFCFSCMKQHVEIKLLHGILPACPHDGCKVMLDMEGSRKFLPPRLQELMREHLKEASIPAKEKVYCPYPKCSALMSKSETIVPQQGSSSKSIFLDSTALRKCIKCNGSFCINCKVPWHDRLSCFEFKRLNPNLHPEEAKLKSLAKQNLWRQCVKCNHMIELSEGCFHMTCRCGFEFCYNCGAEWKNKNPTCQCPLFEYDSEDESSEFYGSEGYDSFEDEYYDYQPWSGN